MHGIKILLNIDCNDNRKQNIVNSNDNMLKCIAKICYMPRNNLDSITL